MKRLTITIFCILFYSQPVFSQWNQYHPEYNWYTIKGKHVVVHYNEGAERTAKVVAKIADQVWGPITSLYHYNPGIVHFVIKDIDDYANGATYYFDNKIEIWASALDFDLRGSHNWLRNVISHEFTHMVEIQAAMKITKSIPAVYLQFLNYENKRRPDILYGYPNFIASYPVANVNIPAWFAEGTAQYQRKEFNYDNWDTHRDMILRTRALKNKLLTWNQMGVFDKTSLGNESVYNAGFALVRYISQKYGEDELRKITYKLGKLTNFTIDAAFKDALGKSGIQVYNQWSSFVKKDYKRRIKAVESNLIKGKIIASEGFGNFYPVFSSDSSKVFYISNKSQDYFALSGIYEHNLKTGADKQILSGVRSSIGLVPGQHKIIYSKLSDDNPGWVDIHDIYQYDLKTKQEKRLTFGLRANNPSVSHNGKKIVFLYQKDGTTNLGLIDINGKHFKRLTFFENGEQVYNPKFSEDDSYIVFGYSYRNGRDIAAVDTNASNFRYLIKNKYDERDPFVKNGKLYYACDKTGIFNLYSYNFTTKKTKQLTNVIGGAFMPNVRNDGTIVYAGYIESGYKIFEITPSQQSEVHPAKKYIWTNDPPLGKDKPNGDINKFNIAALRNYNDKVVPDYKPKKYTDTFTKMSFFPFIRYDNYNTSNSGIDKIKPGLYLSSSDMLNKYSLFAGGDVNKRMEYDLFLTLNYNDKLPLLYDLGLKPDLSLELYSVSRKANVDLVFDSTAAGYRVPTDVTYNLFEVDLAAKQRIFNRWNNLEFRFTFSRYTAALGSFIFPHTAILYPSTSNEYFIGRNIQLKYSYRRIHPSVDMDINPVGRKVEIKYDYEFNKYNPDGKYTINNGMLVPLYQDYNFSKLELNLEEAFPVGNDQTLTAKLRAGAILGPTVPDFFNFYLGGLIGMKSYPFYAISGNRIGWLNLTYRFPIWRDIDARIGQLYIDKIFFSVFGDFGNAWNGKFPKLNKFKKGAGAEIRIKINSFYVFPTSLFFSAAYSFDRFTNTVLNEQITYGKKWKFYGGILFDFSL